MAIITREENSLQIDFMNANNYLTKLAVEIIKKNDDNRELAMEEISHIFVLLVESVLDTTFLAGIDEKRLKCMFYEAVRLHKDKFICKE